jgi:hypothetical protein
MEQRLEKLRQQLAPNEGFILCTWDKAEFEPPTKARLGMLPLIAAGKIGDGYRACRMYGTLVKDTDNVFRILFEENLVRVKAGSRKNCVVQPRSLKPGEGGNKVGLQKCLEFGRMPFRLSNDRPGDEIFLKTLESMVARKQEEQEFIPAPEFLISTSSPGNLTPRMNKKLMDAISAQEGYSAFESAAANFYRLAGKVCRQEDYQHICSFEIAYGRGNILADISKVENRTFKVPIANIDISTSEFCRFRLKKLMHQQ